MLLSLLIHGGNPPLFFFKVIRHVKLMQRCLCPECGDWDQFHRPSGPQCGTPAFIFIAPTARTSVATVTFSPDSFLPFHQRLIFFSHTRIFC